MSNPFDDILGGSPAQAATPAPSSGANPFDDIFQHSSAPTSVAVKNPFDGILGESPASTQASAKSGNPFDGIFGGSPASKSQSQPDNSDEPWYSQAWDWANKPLVDLKRDGATGIEAGVEDVASGFTSPLSIALTAATFGAGPLLESLGLNLAKMAAPEVLSAAKTAGKLASAGFTAIQLKGVADASPSFVQAVKNGDTDKALEIGTTMLAQGGLAALGAKHTYDGVFGDPAESAQFTSKDKLIGRYQTMLKEDNEQARNFNIEFKKAVPDMSKRDAIQFYAESGGDADKLADWQSRIEDSEDIKPALKRQVVDALTKAQSLSDTEVAQAGKLRELYDPDFEEAASKDLLSTESRKTDYVARARWQGESEDSNDVANAKTQLGEGNQPNHTKQRIFETTVDGILNGYEPVKVGNRYALDAADIASDYHRAIGKEVAKRSFVENALQGRAEDGRPLAVQSGSGSALDSGTTITNSLSIPDKTIPKAELATLQQSGTLQSLIDDGKVVDAGDGKYKYDTTGFDNDIRSPHTNGYAYGGSPDVLVKAPVAFHPDIADTAKTILAPEPSKIRSIPGVNTIMNASSFAKHTLLGGSGFHWVQEGLRGVESGVNPFNLERWDMTNPEHVRLIEAGGLQPGIENGAASFTEGLKGDGLLAKIPGVGDFLNKSNQALFGASGFIDRLKLTSALKFADRLKDSNPDMDTMTRYKVAGQMANARFGGLNYLAMGRSKEAQDIMRLTLLAPDWIESQIRDTGFALAYPKLGGKDLARIALYNFGAARVLNMAVSGNPHFETPFGVVSKDGKKEYAVRTMPSDIYHAVTDPMGFAANRLNPITTRTTMEAVTGRDRMGRKRDMGEQLKDLFSNMTPIPMQGIEDRITGNQKPGSSLSDSALSAAGLTTKPNYSPAEELALKLSSDRAGTGSLPSEQLERQHRITQLEERFRGGDKSAMGDVQNMVQGGALTPDDAKKIMAGGQTTRLVSSVRSLPMSNVADVWDRATNQEREQMAPVVLKKMESFRKTEYQKLTQVERDRMNTRLAKVFNDMAQRGK